MSKFGKGLVSDIKEEKAYQEEQRGLKEKYKLENQDVVVVETSNAWEFTITMLIRLIRFSASVIILILAIIGLYTLAYPEIRKPFLLILETTFKQITSFF